MNKMLQLFKHYDVDQNGEIGFEDLLDCMKQQGIEINENEVLGILQNFNQGEKNLRNPEKLTLNYYQFVEAALCQ
jgi:Ca2+-binding EF-hand superfamily protein